MQPFISSAYLPWIYGALHVLLFALALFISLIHSRRLECVFLSICSHCGLQIQTEAGKELGFYSRRNFKVIPKFVIIIIIIALWQKPFIQLSFDTPHFWAANAFLFSSFSGEMVCCLCQVCASISSDLNSIEKIKRKVPMLLLLVRSLRLSRGIHRSKIMKNVRVRYWFISSTRIWAIFCSIDFFYIVSFRIRMMKTQQSPWIATISTVSHSFGRPVCEWKKVE